MGIKKNKRMGSVGIAMDKPKRVWVDLERRLGDPKPWAGGGYIYYGHHGDLMRCHDRKGTEYVRRDVVLKALNNYIDFHYHFFATEKGLDKFLDAELGDSN